MIDWNLIRAAGIGAFLMLWASVAWGLAATTSLFGKRVSKATSIALHQAASTAGLLLLAAHLGLLLVDRFMPFTPLDLVIPMRATYRPVGVTLGIAAIFLMVFGVLMTSWGRKLIGTKWWRRTHALSVPAFALAMMHGLMTGTDSRRPAMFWMYLGSAAIVVFLLLLRAFTADRARRVAAAERVPRARRGSTDEPTASGRPAPAQPRRSLAQPPAPVVIVQETAVGASPIPGFEERAEASDPRRDAPSDPALSRRTVAAHPIRRAPGGHTLRAEHALHEGHRDATARPPPSEAER
jgi:sulfoxide reductase heme-binding subunit YedZ